MMDTYLRQFDVCIVCALPEEARALLDVLRPYCDGEIEEHSSPRYQYSYRTTTIRNKQGDPLTVHISWLPRYGPTEMALHLTRVLEECQPRIAIMTGICAGDAKQVKLGDLVVAERTFTYDSGKFTCDERGRQVHLHDTQTYQLDAAILQFLGLFDDWKSLVAALPHPATQPEDSLKDREVCCHLKAMASGSAVRADHPFADVRVPVRGTAAIDMEGAAFALAASRHHHTSWLVVKGVCDYADSHKNDVYHDYAARASALYALSFIKSYITDGRLPRHSSPSSMSQANTSRIWNIPYPRNPFFLGREDLLAQLANVLQPGQAVALSPPHTQAISGLGGIGKTQIALKYAYRYRHDYHAVLWASAETRESLVSSYVSVAALLHLPEHAAKEQEVIVQAVKHWLQAHHDWLLILDNADDLTLLPEFLPPAPGGHLLLTTRAAATGRLAHRIEVETLSPEQGALLLLRRAGLLAPEATLAHASEQEHMLAMHLSEELGGLPLALDQAGAYLEETKTDLAGYKHLFEQHRADLLRRRGAFAHDYPASVATTWSLAFAQVKATHPASADLLCLCAYFSPDAIAEELFVHGAPFLGPVLAPVAADAFSFNQVIEALLAYSLISRDPEKKFLSIHRLVQAVLQDQQDPAERQIWIERAVRAVNATFPHVEYGTWAQCERLLPLALSIVAYREHPHLMIEETARLCFETASYLRARARFGEAEPLLQQALLIREQCCGPGHPDVALSLNGLANFYQETGNYAKAEPLLQRALLIREQHDGPEHPAVASSLNSLANLWYQQGTYVEAERLYRRALSIWEQQAGPAHPGSAYCLNGLAVLCYQQEKYAEAASFYQRALLIHEQQAGPEHPHVAALLNNLAIVYHEQGKYQEAQPLYERALRIREQQGGPDHPKLFSPLNNLAKLYQEQGKDTEAEHLYRRVLRLWEQREAPAHPQVACSLHGLATLYVAQGKHTEAQALYERALSIREHCLGTHHAETAEILHDLGMLAVMQGQYQEAQSLYQRALAIREQALGQTHPKTRATRKRLTALRASMRQEAGAPSEDDLSLEQGGQST